MAAVQDAKGRMIPSWARYVEEIAPAGSHTGFLTDGNRVPFALYLNDDSTIVFTTIEDQTTEITFTFGAGYHAIAFNTIVSSTAAALALFASKPNNA